MSTTTALRDIRRRRGIRRVVHSHADHFEPEAVAKRLGAAADVALWLERCKPAVPTLFVKCPLGYRLDVSAENGAALYLSSTADIEAGYLRTLVGLGVGIGLHVHHEAWTCNDLRREKLAAGQLEIHDDAIAHDSQALDYARMRAMTAGSLAWLREATGMALETWGFVHGCWAFGASDPEICKLQDELPLLYDLGCRSDYSFPAGRRYCDPPWDRPKWIRPASGIRAFEQPYADPRDRADESRMLVWASRAGAWRCGLDTYTEDSRRLTESPDKIERYLALCPVINGTAYVKTCGHGMNQYYWPSAEDPTATVGAFARELVATCEGMRVPVEFATTEQVEVELAKSTA